MSRLRRARRERPPASGATSPPSSAHNPESRNRASSAAGRLSADLMTSLRSLEVSMSLTNSLGCCLGGGSGLEGMEGDAEETFCWRAEAGAVGGKSARQVGTCASGTGLQLANAAVAGAGDQIGNTTGAMPRWNRPR